MGANPEVADFFGLPRKIRQEDGSRDKMESLFQKIDGNNDRKISWEEFFRFYRLQVRGPKQFPIGASVEYLSVSLGTWMSAKVQAFHASTGLYDLDIKAQIPGD